VDNIPQTKLIDYINQKYELQIAILQDEMNHELANERARLEQQMVAKLAEYRSQEERKLRRHAQQHLADARVDHRVAVDQYKQKMIEDLIGTAIQTVETQLQADEIFAKTYYQLHLRERPPTPIHKIVIDQRFILLPAQIWPDFDGEIQPSNNPRLDLYYADKVEIISPQSMYEMQKKEIRAFVQSSLFG